MKLLKIYCLNLKNGAVLTPDLSLSEHRFDAKWQLVLRYNDYIDMNNNYYETSILDESLENKNLNSIKEYIENYKGKLLSSYWTEINLIGYKIKLLEKQRVEYSKELKSRIIHIGNKISKIFGSKNPKIYILFLIIIAGTIKGNKVNCFNCGNIQSKRWYSYLKEVYLCFECGLYKQNMGKLRPKELWFKKKFN
uniref:GATA-type domain-containing protein n=1 Tax=Meloidogyne enterolobii TaxID=390850 RepID=A0A6V7WWP3_MELEN|nr:unnamed protein product [Meloidogyne enterolobii]